MIAMRSMLASMTWSVKTLFYETGTGIDKVNMTVDVALGRAFGRRCLWSWQILHLSSCHLSSFMQLWLLTHLIVVKVSGHMDAR